MASTIPTTTLNLTDIDEILSTPPITSTTEVIDNGPQLDFDLTNYILFIFPLYIWAVLLNILSIYTILIAKVYRQYLSNVLLVVICIGALINVHGQMFLILLRWANSSLSNQLCSSSFYLRDSGSILIHTHILLLALERIVANLKKNPTSIQNNLIQKAHFFLIIMSFICILLSLTIPIFTFKNSSFSPFDGLCIPFEIISFKKYFNLIYYGFSYPLVLSSSILLIIYFTRKTTISYSTLIPMNKIILIISSLSCINLLFLTLFDDMIGIGNERPVNTKDIPSAKLVYTMNIRDSICIIHKLIIGLLFFLFRPEIRLWLYETMKRFQSNKKEIVTPQMLDIRSELDDNYRETDDGNIQFRTDI